MTPDEYAAIKTRPGGAGRMTTQEHAEWKVLAAACEHGPWRTMTSNEAYPALAGRVCTKCDLVNLTWQ